MAAAQFSVRFENKAVARLGITPYHPEKNSHNHTTGVCLAQFSIAPFRLHRYKNQALAAAQFGITPYHPERNSRYHTTGVCFDSTPSQEDTGDFGLKVNGSEDFVEETTSDSGLKVNGSEESVEKATRHTGLIPNPDGKTFTYSGKVYENSDISFMEERNRKTLESLARLSDMFEEGPSLLLALHAMRSGNTLQQALNKNAQLQAQVDDLQTELQRYKERFGELSPVQAPNDTFTEDELIGQHVNLEDP